MKRSQIDILKSRGPNIDPCGTPSKISAFCYRTYPWIMLLFLKGVHCSAENVLKIFFVVLISVANLSAIKRDGKNGFFFVIIKSFYTKLNFRWKQKQNYFRSNFNFYKKVLKNPNWMISTFNQTTCFFFNGLNGFLLSFCYY